MRQEVLDQLTIDALEQQLIEIESLKSRLTAHQLDLLREADTRQAPLADGCRSLQEWTAGRLDIAPETARTLVTAAKTLADQPDLHDRLEKGSGSFDRILATGQLVAAGGSPDRVEQSEGFDIPGVRRLTARRRRLTRPEQQQVFADRFLSVQPTLDRTGYRLWGQLPGTDGGLVEQALLTRADSFTTLLDGSRGTLSQRRADALVSISQDSLTTSSGDHDSSAGPLLSVFTTSGPDREVGSTTASGIAVGSQTIEEIFCTGSVEHITFQGGQPLAAGRTSRVIPPRLRRAVLFRDGGCTADGCTSRYRLQPHHIIPWSQGGPTNPDNLTTLCCRIRRLRPISSGDNRRRRRNRAFTIMSSSTRWAIRSSPTRHQDDSASTVENEQQEFTGGELG